MYRSTQWCSTTYLYILKLNPFEVVLSVSQLVLTSVFSMVYPGLSRDPFGVVSIMVPSVKSVVITGVAVPVITPVVGPVVTVAVVGVWICAGKSKQAQQG